MDAPLPAELAAQLEAFNEGALTADAENLAQLLDDGLTIIDGIRDAIQIAYTNLSANEVIEIVQRLLWPPLLAGLRRHPKLDYWYPTSRYGRSSSTHVSPRTSRRRSAGNGSVSC